MDNNKKITTGIVIAATLGLIYGIFEYYKYQVRKALSYCYKIATIGLVKISTSLISLDFFIKVQNKSSFSVLLKGYDLNIFVNNLRVANLLSVKEELISNNAISDITLRVDFNPSDVFKIGDIANIVAYFMTDKNKIVISVNGYLFAKMNFLKIKLPLNFKMTLKEIMSTDSASEAKKTICDIK